MFYPKNVPNFERIFRIILGAGLLLLALFGSSLIGQPTPLGTGLLVFSALFIVVTGFIGWCPACAMVGRKLKNKVNER
jgi:hypothetical protein